MTAVIRLGFAWAFGFFAAGCAMALGGLTSPNFSIDAIVVGRTPHLIFFRFGERNRAQFHGDQPDFRDVHDSESDCIGADNVIAPPVCALCPNDFRTITRGQLSIA